MGKMIRAICITVMLSNAFLFSQTVSVDDYTFVRQQGKWYKIYQGKLFEVSTRTIAIKLRTGVSARDIEPFHRANNITRWRQNRFGCLYLSLPDGVDAVEYVLRYRNNHLVEWAEVSTYGRFLGMPNDPNFGSQWYLQRIEMPRAWNIHTGNASVIVGILDSGTDWTHPDIGPTVIHYYQNIWLNPGEDAWADPTDPATGNQLDDDCNGNPCNPSGPPHTYIDDWKGWLYSGIPTYESNDSRGVPGQRNPHGTQVAGIVAAKTNNSTGIAGVAGGWTGTGARMMILGFHLLEEHDFADAVAYAVDKGAKILQLSLEFPYSKTMALALGVAHSSGLFIACASGNNDPDVTFPANYPVVVAVGATNQADTRASFSNYGSSLDIAAPGTDILTTTIDTVYVSVAGTSFASPQVSALAALIWSVNPSLANLQVEDIIKSTADKVGGYNYNWDPNQPGHSRELGYGRINAYRALSKANGPPSIRQISSITIHIENQNAYPELDWTLAPEIDVQDGGFIAIERRTKAIIDPSWSPWTVFATLNGSSTSYIDYDIRRMCIGTCPDSVQYRIRAQDYAGLYSPNYSDVVTITAYGIWYKRPGDVASVPIHFELSVPYPNPFNPTTTIRFSVESASGRIGDPARVALKVFDVLAREVATLVDEVKPAGTHTVDFDARHLSSGVYYYRLTAGQFTQTKRMILLR